MRGAWSGVGEGGVRVDSSLAAGYAGALAPWPRPVTPVASAAALAPATERPTAQGPTRLDIQRHAVVGVVPAGKVDTAGLTRQAQRAVHSYLGVRDGDRREYLHRVLGLEDRA
jgi:hypothetical protein